MPAQGRVQLREPDGRELAVLRPVRGERRAVAMPASSAGPGDGPRPALARTGTGEAGRVIGTLLRAQSAVAGRTAARRAGAGAATQATAATHAAADERASRCRSRRSVPMPMPWATATPTCA